MPPVQAIIGSLGLLKTSSDIIKEAMQFARDAKNTDLAAKLLDVYQDMLQVIEANRELQEQITQLKKQADIEQYLRFDRNTGEYTLEKDGKADGPFCGTCWDIDHRLVRTTRSQRGSFCDYCSNRRPKR